MWIPAEDAGTATAIRAARGRRAAARMRSRRRGRRAESARRAAGSSAHTAEHRAARCEPPRAAVGFAAVVVLATTSFYIAGGVLAVWAVVVTVLGMMNPRFPGNLTGQRVVIAISAVLVVLAIGTAVTTSKTEETHQPGITKDTAKHD